MSTDRSQAAPLRFLVLVAAGWIAARGVVIEGWRPGGVGDHGRAIPARPDARQQRQASRAPPGSDEAGGCGREARACLDFARHERVGRNDPRRYSFVEVARSLSIASAVGQEKARSPTTPASLPATEPIAGADPAWPSLSPGRPAEVAPSTPLAPVSFALAPTSAGSRLSGSDWAFVRGGGRARPLAPVGQIGGGQAGVRLLYRLAGPLSASARISRTIGGPDQTEAALGLDWRPIAGVPLHLTTERRIAIDRGGRNAWSLGVAGGAYAVPLSPGWRLDGYGEAGVVGFHARDPYGDGAVRAGREVRLGASSLTVGGGLWGAAQPHAARLDGGPSAVLRVPVSGRTIAAALDWRGRLAGGARPHSGVALTVGVDF